MASTYTPNLHLELMGTGDQPGTWGAEMNTTVFTVLDTVLGGTLNLPLTNANVTLTTTQAQNNLINLSGALTANITLTFPNIGRHYIVRNATSGNFSVTLKVAAGPTVVARQGYSMLVVLSGGGVYTDNLGFVPVRADLWAANKIYIGYNGLLALQIDNTYYSNTWPLNVTGNANTASSVGGVSNPTAKNTLIAYQSGTVEFGSIITDGTNITVDLPSPYVMTGLRSSPSYAGGIATITTRGRALMTQ